MRCFAGPGFAMIKPEIKVHGNQPGREGDDGPKCFTCTLIFMEFGIR